MVHTAFTTAELRAFANITGVGGWLQVTTDFPQITNGGQQLSVLLIHNRH